jgi:hypothetical protein
MKKSFLDFVNEQKENNKKLQYLNEAFKVADVDNAIELIEKVLKKHINGLLPLVDYVETVIDGKNCMSKQFMVLDKTDWAKTSVFQLNWLLDAQSAEVYSIDFFADGSDLIWAGRAKSDLTIKTLGTSVAYFLPIIWTVVNDGKYDITEKEAIELTEQTYKDKNVKESMLHIGTVSYHIYEGLSDDVINDTFMLETKSSKEVRDYRQQKQNEKAEAYAHRHDSPAAKAHYKKLLSEYEAIQNAIENGADTVEDIKLAIQHGANVTVKTPQSILDHESEIEEKKDPDQVFKEMQKYIKMVISGLQPSLIICGAPGVGKTFRVKQQLKANGYVEGSNMLTLKGKCTPRALYTALYDMKGKGDILMIDDADSLVGPNAPEDSINILKAALDSTADDEGRLVTYNVAGKLFDNEGLELPKRFYYNGGAIVLTNYTAGQLDTALRGRSFIQDINFSVEDILHIIHKLLPNIEPQRYSMEAKQKAYEYLVELNEEGTKMELSLRTFGICAKLYMAAEKDNDFTEEDVRSMIKEQMKLLSARGGKKY